MQQQKWEIVQNVETLLLESGAGMGKLPSVYIVFISVEEKTYSF